jgi:hypothetical protein
MRSFGPRDDRLELRNDVAGEGSSGAGQHQQAKQNFRHGSSLDLLKHQFTRSRRKINPSLVAATQLLVNSSRDWPRTDKELRGFSAKLTDELNLLLKQIRTAIGSMAGPG